MDMGGKREVKGDGRGEAEREKEASVRRIRGVFDVEEAREARESRLAWNGEKRDYSRLRCGIRGNTKEQCEFGEVGPVAGLELS